MNWTNDRIVELEQLERLLIECRALNSASGIVQRLERCEQIADVLATTDFTIPRHSFLQFLRALAIEDRTK